MILSLSKFSKVENISVTTPSSPVALLLSILYSNNLISHFRTIRIFMHCIFISLLFSFSRRGFFSKVFTIFGVYFSLESLLWYYTICWWEHILQDVSGIEKITEIANEIYDLIEDLSRTSIVPAPKISVQMNTCSIILILLKKTQSRIRSRPGIKQEQWRFNKDYEKEIFKIRMISNIAIQIQRNIQLCFIDYAKGFD